MSKVELCLAQNRKVNLSFDIKLTNRRLWCSVVANENRDWVIQPGGSQWASESKIIIKKFQFVQKHDADECETSEGWKKEGKKAKIIVCLNFNCKKNIREKRLHKMPTTKTAKKIQFEHRSMMLISLSRRRRYNGRRNRCVINILRNSNFSLHFHFRMSSWR